MPPESVVCRTTSLPWELRVTTPDACTLISCQSRSCAETAELNVIAAASAAKLINRRMISSKFSFSSSFVSPGIKHLPRQEH
jgi:hypothetical protein